jgi:hypothetical protein
MPDSAVESGITVAAKYVALHGASAEQKLIGFLHKNCIFKITVYNFRAQWKQSALSAPSESILHFLSDTRSSNPMAIDPATSAESTNESRHFAGKRIVCFPLASHQIHFRFRLHLNSERTKNHQHR